MTKNPVFHGITKHIETWHHFIRRLVTNGEIVLEFYGTNDQVAHLFIKSLPQLKHDYFRR